MPTKRAANPNRIPKARPAFAPPDIPPVDGSAVDVADMAADAVADATLTAVEAALGVGDLVATTSVDAAFVVSVFCACEVATDEGLLEVAAGLVVDVGLSSSAVVVVRCRVAGATSVLASSDWVTQTTFPVYVFVMDTISMEMTVSTATLSSSWLRLRWRRPRWAWACW